MESIQLSAGPIEYEDTGGAGPALVLLHGVLMNEALWSGAVAQLRGDHRCVVPVLPMGAHRVPMRTDADLSWPAVADLVAELIERLDLRDVTVVGNDTGGAIAQLLVGRRPDIVDRLVLASCEAFDNYPPGLPGKFSAVAGAMPGGIYMSAQSLRLPLAQRMPFTFGWMAKRPIPREVLTSWMGPARSSRAVRRDFKRFAGSVDRAEMMRASTELEGFDKPALVVWAVEDRVMPPEHGRRLARLLAHSRHVEIADSYTLIPLDQPVALAREIRAFVSAHPRADDTATLAEARADVRAAEGR